MREAGIILDELDRSIVQRLRVDGREANRSLAAALDVNEATIAARLRRLESGNVIHVVAQTDIARLGFDCFALVFVSVHNRPVIEAAMDISHIPQTISVNVTTGRYDLICGVVAQDRSELSDVLGNAIAAIDGVEDVRCELAADVPRFDSAWAALGPERTYGGFPQPRVPPGLVDELDLQIIGSLQRDARSSNRKIASHLNISEGTVRARLRRMEDAGLLRIQAVSDVMSFGLGASATIGVHVSGGLVESVLRGIEEIDGMGAIIRTIGSFSFVLVAVGQTREFLFESVLNRLQAIPGVRSTETFEHISTIKHVYMWCYLSASSDPALAGQ